MRDGGADRKVCRAWLSTGLSVAKVGDVPIWISKPSGLFADQESDRVALAIAELLINAEFPSHQGRNEY
jgi:hypothetical protein